MKPKRRPPRWFSTLIFFCGLYVFIYLAVTEDSMLDWLPTGVPGLVPKRRLAGLSLRATDQDWSWGRGDEIVGPSEALAMAVSGRAVALDDLSGSGVALLRSQLNV